MSVISLFRNYNEPDNPQYIDFMEYLEMIRDGAWQDVVFRLRNLSTKEERSEFKDIMQTASMSGKFKRRANDSLVEHNEYLAMDLDELGNNVEKLKSRFAKDNYVKACFVSAGGYGLRPIFKINPEKHNESFKAISKYIFDNYGEVVDCNGGVSKPYIVSFDPGAYINYGETKLWDKYLKEIPVKKLPDFIDSSGDFEEIAKKVISSGTNICEDYNDWLKVGFAISEKLGENGRVYFHDMSKLSSKYKFERCDKQYNYFLRARGTKKINIASFYYLARNAGIKIVSEQTKEIVRSVRNGKAAGLKPEQIIENLAKYQEIVGVDKMVQEVFDKSEVSTDKESMVEQLELFIKNNYNIKMNEVTGFLENDEDPMNENDINSLFVNAKKQFEKLDYYLVIRLLKSDFISLYNPFMQFFNSDGTPQHLPVIPVKAEDVEYIPSPLIDKLCDCIQNEHRAYTRFFLKKWIVSIISACHKVHSPLLLVLIGPQGTGKTEFFRNLLPKEIKQYYGESTLKREKDDEILMTQKLLLCLDEFEINSKLDNEKLKMLTSKQVFNIRRPYGTSNEDMLRLAVLCATTNKLGILSDSTGNRRVIPIEVDKIDYELYNSIDKKELFREVYTLYRKGFDWRITHLDIPFLNERQEKYDKPDIIAELIQMLYSLPTEENKLEWEKLSATEIKLDMESAIGKPFPNGISSIIDSMNKQNFVMKTVRMSDGTTPKKFIVVKAGRGANKKRELNDIIDF